MSPSDLEKAVEALSQMLQEDITPETVHSLRQRMIDKTVCFSLTTLRSNRLIILQTYVRKRREIVLEDSALGLQDGRWKWTISVE